MDKSIQYRCTLCHSTEVKMKMWGNPNLKTTKEFEPSADEDDMENCYCGRCETHVRLEPIPYHPPYLLKCSQCGSTDVETVAWVKPNEDDASSSRYSDKLEEQDCYCNECEENVSLIYVELEKDNQE